MELDRNKVNYTIDTLMDIAQALDVQIANLFVADTSEDEEYAKKLTP